MGRVGKLFVLLPFAIVSLSAPASGQGFGAMSDDVALETTRDWAATHPITPATPSLVPECLAGPSLPFERLTGKLSLTDEQHMALYNFDRTCANLLEGKTAQLHSMQRDLENVMTTPELDPKSARDLQKQIDQIRQDLSDTCLEYQIKALSVLNPDQRQGLRTIMAKQRHSFWHHLW